MIAESINNLPSSIIEETKCYATGSVAATS